MGKLIENTARDFRRALPKNGSREKIKSHFPSRSLPKQDHFQNTPEALLSLFRMTSGQKLWVIVFGPVFLLYLKVKGTISFLSQEIPSDRPSADRHDLNINILLVSR